MNKKTIQITVVVICFLGAGFVLYKGLGGGGSSAPVSTPVLNATLPGGAVTSTSTTASNSTGTILPMGQNLNFSVLNSQGFKFDIVTPPQVATTEIGISEENLIASPPSSGSNNGQTISQ